VVKRIIESRMGWGILTHTFGTRQEKDGCMPDLGEDGCMPDLGEDGCMPDLGEDGCMPDLGEDRCMPDLGEGCMPI
jgi:hypothetical protein